MRYPKTTVFTVAGIKSENQRNRNARSKYSRNGIAETAASATYPPRMPAKLSMVVRSGIAIMQAITRVTVRNLKASTAVASSASI